MTNRYELKIYPDAVLRHRAEPVNNMDGETHELVKAMQNIMDKNRGIGLAAPQVGVLRRIILADIGEGFFVLANPVILYQEGRDHMVEGCLSLPDVEVNVGRNQAITVTGINIGGEEIKEDLSGLMARVVQHEIDHLNGVLIIDHQEA